MPIDLSALGESLGRGLSEIPPVAIALALLAGPTAALVGYRLIGAARRLPATGQIEPAPFWVCHECRSINELRQTRCYHCSLSRDLTPDVEIIIDAPIGSPATFDVPAGSPFAALGGRVDRAAATTGVPVMSDASSWNTGVPVGPGRADTVAVPVVAEDGDSLLLANAPGADEELETADVTLFPATERQS
jgi:hypothetical protein